MDESAIPASVKAQTPDATVQPKQTPNGLESVADGMVESILKQATAAASSEPSTPTAAIEKEIRPQEFPEPEPVPVIVVTESGPQVTSDDEEEVTVNAEVKEVAIVDDAKTIEPSGVNSEASTTAPAATSDPFAVDAEEEEATVVSGAPEPLEVKEPDRTDGPEQRVPSPAPRILAAERKKSQNSRRGSQISPSPYTTEA